jgi:3-methyl-2-oxobutanoate hydroxymethyltransferase
LSKQTITSLKNSKNKQKLIMVTAYDALIAKLLDENVDMILVGDSLNMSFGGKADTLTITLDQMIYHTQAVCNGAPNSFVICDMPFGSYTDEKIALDSAVKVYQQTSAAAIKIEGGIEKAPIIKKLTSNSIAVMGHIGLMPQFVRSEGGYKVKGKDEQNILSLVEDAKAIEEAGAFALVVEGVKAEAAKAITEAVSIPVIGIGAGKDVDGQVLVWSDMFGFFEDFKPKFVRQYLNGAKLIKDGLEQFKSDVQSQNFPNEDEMY